MYIMRQVCEWYWRNDDEEGFVEDYTLSIQNGEEMSEDEEGGGEGEGGRDPDISYVTFLEGCRSQRGQSTMQVCVC
jgi:hypothetical protein